MWSRNNKGFDDEYQVSFSPFLYHCVCMCLGVVLLQSLYTGEDKSISIATDSKNRRKNRFANIIYVSVSNKLLATQDVSSVFPTPLWDVCYGGKVCVYREPWIN